jgi:hypothetical protein
MRQMYNFAGLVDSLFRRAFIYMLKHCHYAYGSCRMRHFCIAILLYVIPNYLDVLISSDVFCMSNVI